MAQTSDAAFDWRRCASAKLARIPGSEMRNAGPHSVARPPSAGTYNMASTVSAIAGRTKYRGLNSII